MHTDTRSRRRRRRRRWRRQMTADKFAHSADCAQRRRRRPNRSHTFAAVRGRGNYPAIILGKCGGDGERRTTNFSLLRLMRRRTCRRYNNDKCWDDAPTSSTTHASTLRLGWRGFSDRTLKVMLPSHATGPSARDEWRTSQVHFLLSTRDERSATRSTPTTTSMRRGGFASVCIRVCVCVFT